MTWGLFDMGYAVAPRSLRSFAAINSSEEKTEGGSGGRLTAVVGLIAVASVTGAEAQTSLPPVTVEAPVARPRPVASRPTAAQIRAREALRRAARSAQTTAPAAPLAFPNAGGLRADRNPYADAAAPYKVDHLQASGKFPEPLLNTPKTVTVISKDVLADENATSLKQAVLNTAGVTLGTGEGGNAFGDRFFVRGFDTRNDVFIDGVRDSGVSVRENFFTEQIEILRGPGSSFAGRGTTGGAINIVTKQATTEKSFYNMDETVSTDPGERVTLDVNQVISPTFAVRAGGVFQKAGIEGRDFVSDDRGGGFVATTWKPTDAVKVTADYVHTDIHGLPDFGVPYYRPNSAGSAMPNPSTAPGAPATIPFNTTAGGPYPSFGGSDRNTFYGLLNRDFFEVHQDLATINTEVKVTPDLTLNDKIRASRSLLNYIGTIPESPITTGPMAGTFTANPQSRRQQTDVVDNQIEATYKFDTGSWHHTSVAGVEVSREISSIDSYTGLTSELVGRTQNGTGSFSGLSVFDPGIANDPFGTPTLTGRPTKIAIDTTSGYLIDSANYRDLVILNGGVRLDDYGIKASGFGTVNGVPNVFGAQAAQFDMPNFNVGLTLKPLPITSVYAAYATSSDPVGSEFDGTSANYGGLAPVLNGSPNQIFGPMKNSAIEIGNKWELFERHLLVSGAVFETDVTNARESVNAGTTPSCPYPAGGVGTIACISAGAAYQIRGVDLEAAGKITDKWSVFGGLVLMKSEVTKSLVPPANTTLYSTNVGLPLANIAHQSFSLLSKYQIDDRWEVGGQAIYRSKIYGGTLLAANQGTSLPSFWRFDTFAEAKIDKHWTVKVFVNNIFNKLYYTALYQSATPFVLEAPGRTAALQISARF
jgi:catecholate siderophore receptor